ncbi:MAG: FecR domain-containing protein [Pedobacter sp.]|jgi:ferric-dicitrate binding protein FerR (iron transport regulator)|uniref:FecR family protein n=1 Tax=Pedobacter sp. TaxID=1411316 RepID=UPI00356AB835
MTRKETEDLFNKYEQGLCNAEELAWIETWYIHLNEDKEIDLRSADLEASELRMMQALHIKQTPSVPLWKKVAVAASIVLVSSVSYYFLQRKEVLNEASPVQMANLKIPPGGNKAILTLADGRRINLEEKADGKLAEESGVKIIKKASGEIIYDVSHATNVTAAQRSYHTIETPRGGTYQVLLEDGSKVWLNAASSIKFPSSFSSAERIVELKGEAYFEVAKNPARPFTVKVEGQSIQVLGTKFNVNSYRDEAKLVTTLLEGSVRMSNLIENVVLKPGEQSQSTINQKIELRKVETEEFLAWKEGMFSFQRANLQTVLRQFERWYNIDVKFEKNAPDIFFTGKIYRNLNLDEALNNLTFLGVRFKIQNRNVTVLSK